MELRIEPRDADQRLDIFLAERVEELSRSRVQRLIKEGAIQLNDKATRASHLLRPGDRINVEIPQAQPLAIEPEAIPLKILFEDEHLLVVDKAADMTVHPAPGAWTGTLVHALLHHCRDLSGINGVLRPGIVHRLDRHTTGLLVVAKSDAAHRSLAEQLAQRRIERCYQALVWGHPEERGTIDAPIDRHPKQRIKMAVLPGGRTAVTHYQTLQRFAFTSLLELRLDTGRTHQIRVHLQHLGFPVFGDPLYGGRNQAGGIRAEWRRRANALLNHIDRQALHAWRLAFIHPDSGQPLNFEAPLPDDFARLIAATDSDHS
ncbi:MAG: RluA family pseudouridine synthase [Candidatus Latescibacteria bacterium]|nr:RluA family pseudouridine synthase [Candidatus Latescibacterota bacterium]